MLLNEAPTKWELAWTMTSIQEDEEKGGHTAFHGQRTLGRLGGNISIRHRHPWNC